jgi:hypothetical protein
VSVCVCQSKSSKAGALPSTGRQAGGLIAGGLIPVAYKVRALADCIIAVPCSRQWLIDAAHGGLQLPPGIAIAISQFEPLTMFANPGEVRAMGILLMAAI